MFCNFAVGEEQESKPAKREEQRMQQAVSLEAETEAHQTERGKIAEGATLDYPSQSDGVESQKSTEYPQRGLRKSSGDFEI